MIQVVLITSLLTFIALDIYTTTKILQRGGEELNPLVRWLMSKLGVRQGLLIRVPVQILALAALSMAGTWGLAIVALLYSVVLINNFLVLRKL